MGENLNAFFKSVIDQDRCSVVICDLQHIIIYMNPAACAAYAKRGGAALMGRNLMACHNPDSVRKIEEVVAWFAADASHNMIHTFRNEEQNKDGYMVALRDEAGTLIGYYEKHEFRNPETAAMYDYENPIK